MIAITALTDSPEPVMTHFSEKNPLVEPVKDADWKDRWLEYYHGTWID